MKILMPIDGSDCALETLEWAINTLDKNNVDFYLLHVIEPVLETPIEYFEIEKANTHLTEAKEALENSGFQVSRTDYKSGSVGDEICQYANEIEADQVLIGSHGRSGLAKLLLGSVSAHVLEHCEQPVFIYRNTQKVRFGNCEMMTPNKML